MKLNLKKPCANCPFLKNGAIELAPRRLENIIAGLLADDFSNFLCHKTVHSKQGGDWIEDEEGESLYAASGNESMCIGSAIYMLKLGRPSVSLRFALIKQLITLDELTGQNNLIIDPMPSCQSEID